jgi:hypothetical protein
MLSVKPNKLSKKFSALDHQIKRSDDPLPKTGYIQHLIIGQKGSGKSTFIINMLKHKDAYRKFFDNIFLISPTAKNDNKFDKLIKELDKVGNYYTECNEENVNEVLNKVLEFNDSFDEEEEKRKPHSLLILDDCIHDLPKGQQKSIINNIFTTNRHRKLSIWVASQKLKAISTLIRNQADLLTIWRTNEKVEREGIIDTWSIPEEIYDFATADPNSYLHVSFFAGKPIYFKKLDRIIVN